MQSFVNAHFVSKKLAEKFKEVKKESMLHFIFNQKFICVLITYDLDIGDFVLQIPYFPKIGQREDYSKDLCKIILKDLLSKNNIESSLDNDIVKNYKNKRIFYSFIILIQLNILRNLLILIFGK